ncbi:hypothetical protein HYT84_01520, partial [Candidatus Micrarchaeota archaeon]|nr:hypothetical protein [Candidatus Micrarchaeota archaeon]
MITGGKIDKVEATKANEVAMAGLNINVALDDVKVKGKNIEIDYTYTATYADNIGEIKLKGTLFATEDDKLSKEVEATWKKNKKVPDEYAEALINAINYTCSANGTLIARVLNMAPPI